MSRDNENRDQMNKIPALDLRLEYKYRKKDYSFSNPEMSWTSAVGIRSRGKKLED